jgi:hypothetical protein
LRAEGLTISAGEFCRSCCPARLWYQMTAVAITANTVAAVSKLYVSKDVMVSSHYINDRDAVSLPFVNFRYRSYRRFFVSQALFRAKLSGCQR